MFEALSLRAPKTTRSFSQSRKVELGQLLHVIIDIEHLFCSLINTLTAL